MNFRNFILYGLSVGLNRGIVFFLLPLAGYFLNKNDFGTFSLIIITSQLLIPILTINVSSVIAREFLDAKEMLNRYVGYIV
ncbi:polysaccharide biosynthesis protein, partial [Escherichia coli]|nr:polysaccharide biosynthesis protein [Escherichia coli]